MIGAGVGVWIAAEDEHAAEAAITVALAEIDESVLRGGIARVESGISQAGGGIGVAPLERILAPPDKAEACGVGWIVGIGHEWNQSSAGEAGGLSLLAGDGERLNLLLLRQSGDYRQEVEWDRCLDRHLYKSVVVGARRGGSAIVVVASGEG